MAENKKISGLPEITNPSLSGVTVVVENGVTYKTVIESLPFVPLYLIDNITLSDNSVTNIIIGSTTLHRSTHIMYTLKRGGNYREGIFRLLYNGVNVFYSDDFITDGTDLGIVLAADINGTEIRLTSTLTSTGSDAIIKGQIKRILI